MCKSMSALKFSTTVCYYTTNPHKILYSQALPLLFYRRRQRRAHIKAPSGSNYWRTHLDAKDPKGKILTFFDVY